MLNQLDELKKSFGANSQSRLLKLLNQLSRRRFKDAASLIRLHESLMFMLAYPQNAQLLNQAKKILTSFPERIKYLQKIEADVTPFEEPEVSGIAGTSLSVMLGYKFAQWLSVHHNNEVEIDWEVYEEQPGIRSTLPKMLPLFSEEALVEAHVPFVDYIKAAKPKNRKDLAWLMQQFSALDASEKEKAALYDALKLYISISPVFSSSRTGLKHNAKKIFYHKAPLIQRRDVSLQEELNKPALKIEKLSAKESLEITDIIRMASAVRCRELHGFVWSDEKSFLRVDIGRGVVVFINEVLPENRLPLRAYHSGFVFKNGVPVGYVEGLSLFEKMEIGFNLYYTFREGETAWLFAQLLRIFKQHLGVTVFSIDPYQVGHENEEGIQSGAFWFYRKLGFYPIQNEVSKIIEREEKKLAGRKDYRTSAKTLRKIATSHLHYVHAESGLDSQNEWKDFQLRNILLAIQKEMSKSFNGNSASMKEQIAKKILQVFDVDLKRLQQTELEAFTNLALVLSLIPKLERWNEKEKELMVKIIRAKGSGSEAEYLQLMQQHKSFRVALITIGKKIQ